MGRLNVRRRKLLDSRGTHFGARMHDVVEIQSEGKGYLQIWEWGPDRVSVYIHGRGFRIEARAGNVFDIIWLRKPQRILVPAMMEEESKDE